MEGVCAVCASKAPHCCSSCSSVWYCSVEHQKEHWKVHSKSCPFFKIVEDPKVGKGFVATRDIKPGTVILEEGPVAFFYSRGSEQLACLSCGLDATDRDCSKCELPVCSLECEGLSIHAENECQIFRTKRLPDRYSFYMKDLVKVIRVCLLKRDNPTLYEQVLQLCPNKLHLNHANARTLENFLKKLLAGVKGVETTSKDVGKVLRIIHTNCHSRDRFDLRDPVSSMAGLYLQSSRINHSCIPNCHLQLGSKPEFIASIRTTSAVKKGEALTYFYYLEYFYEGTKRRQEIFQKEANFRCVCARCKDPTEFGTYMSGVVCKACKGNKASTTGYLVPEDPLDLSNDAKWKCNSCECIQLSKDILPEVEELAKRISYLETQAETNRDDGERSIQLCRRLVDETSGITLHPNHWIIQKAMILVGNVGRNSYRSITMTSDLNDYLIRCGKHLMRIHDLLFTGLSFNRAVLHDQLGTVLYFRSVTLLSQERYQQAKIDYEETLLHLKQALKFFGKVLVDADAQILERLKKNISMVSDALRMLR